MEEQLGEEIHQCGQGVDLVDRVHHDGLGGGVLLRLLLPLLVLLLLLHWSNAPAPAPAHLMVLLAPVHGAED